MRSEYYCYYVERFCQLSTFWFNVNCMIMKGIYVAAYYYKSYYNYYYYKTTDSIII